MSNIISEYNLLQDSKQNRIILPGKVTAAVTTKDGHYYIAAIGQNLHIWEVKRLFIMGMISDIVQEALFPLK